VYFFFVIYRHSTLRKIALQKGISDSPRLVFEKIGDMLKAGVNFERSAYHFVQSLAVWYPGMRWAWQNRGLPGVLKALKWSLMG